MNALVSLEIAKLLEEKGFNDPCEKGYYLPHPDIALKNKIEPNIWQLLPMHDLLNQVKAPIIAEVVMWLYHKRGVWISVLFNTSDRVWYFTVIDTVIGGYDTIGNFDSPLKAYEAAIAHCLNVFFPRHSK